jgi:putative thioredoxin
MGQLDQAEALLNNAPEKIAKAPESKRCARRSRWRGRRRTPDRWVSLSAAVEADPGNHQARYDYAQALHASGKVEEAVEQLLELFRRDREWNDGAAKAQLFTIFDALKPTDPIVQKGRRRLSSMIFA